MEVSTRETGTVPPAPFQFHIRAQHAATLEVRNFTLDASQYRDGERFTLVLKEFRPVEESEGEETVYNITVSCSNEFGESGESNEVSVLIVFSAGAYFNSCGDCHWLGSSQ